MGQVGIGHHLCFELFSLFFGEWRQPPAGLLGRPVRRVEHKHLLEIVQCLLHTCRKGCPDTQPGPDM